MQEIFEKIDKILDFYEAVFDVAVLRSQPNKIVPLDVADLQELQQHIILLRSLTGYERDIAIPDRVDWTNIDDQFMWVARNKNGEIRFFTHKPQPWLEGEHAGQWCSGAKGKGVLLNDFIKPKPHTPGNQTWYESLVQRKIEG